MEKRLLICIILMSSAVHAAPFFQDSFESGDLGHSENSAGWTSSASTSVSSDRAHSGTKSLKYSYAASAADYWAEQRFILGQPKTDIYIRYYIYFPTNYKHRATGTAATNNKVIRVWGEDYGESGKMGASFWKGDISILQADAAWTGWPPQLSCNSDGVGPSGALPGTWELRQSDLGRWIAFEFHFKPDDGSGNGAFEFWVDGQRIISQTALEYESAPCSPGYFRNGYLLGAANSGFAENTYIYIDDVAFSTSYIGTGGGGGTNPVCGSNGCESGETCSSCPLDCGACACNPSWTCSDWSACASSQQTRTCADSNSCGTSTGKPAEAQSCTSCAPKTEICGNGIDEDCDGTDLSCSTTTIGVDSTYPGYSTAVIDDGIEDASGGESGTWASDESNLPHWIEFTFQQQTEISKIDVYWAYNANKGYFTSSQELQVQYWDGSKYVTAATITNTASIEKNSISFPKVSTTRLRFYQPANKGYASYSTVLWVTEVDYGNCKGSADADCDGCIEQDELLAFITEWKSGKVMLTNLMEAIGSWKSGC